MHHRLQVRYTFAASRWYPLTFPTAPAPAAPATKIDAPPQVPKTPFVHAPVLKPSTSSPLYSALDTIASDGPITAAVSSTAAAGASQIPELFRSVLPAQSAAVAETAEAAVGSVRKGEQEILQLAALPGVWRARVLREVARRVPAGVREAGERVSVWWRRERVWRVVEAAVPNRKMDGLAADGASPAYTRTFYAC